LHFMDADDKSELLSEFFRVNEQMDIYRNERFRQVFPEFIDLKSYVVK